MRILSIDAWRGIEPDTWEWNNWYQVGEIESLPENDNDVIEILIDMGLLNNKARTLCCVTDDQYNLVIEDKEDSRPLYAIEYGAES